MTLNPEVAKLFSWVEIENQDKTCLRLEVPQFKDIIFKYNNVKLTEPTPTDSDQTLKVTFDYAVLQSPYLKSELDHKELEKVIGSIIIGLLQWHADADTLKEVV